MLLKARLGIVLHVTGFHNLSFTFRFTYSKMRRRHRAPLAKVNCMILTSGAAWNNYYCTYMFEVMIAV